MPAKSSQEKLQSKMDIYFLKITCFAVENGKPGDKNQVRAVDGPYLALTLRNYRLINGSPQGFGSGYHFS